MTYKYTYKGRIKITLGRKQIHAYIYFDLENEEPTLCNIFTPHVFQRYKG